MNTRPNPTAFDAKQRVKLAQILAMTSSPFDAEALVAARKANALLASFAKTWTDAVCGHAPAPKPPKTHKPRKRTWRAFCREVATDKTAPPFDREFCRDLLATFTGGSFSNREEAILREIVLRQRARARERRAA